MSSDAALLLEYHAATKDQVTHRTVIPTELSVVNGRAFLHAWCLGARAHRTFRLDRIVAATCVPHSLTDEEALAVSDTPDAGVSAQSAPTPVQLYLAPSARWLIDTYGLQVTRELPNGACEVVWDVWDQQWLTRHIIEWGGTVAIVSPASWRDHLLSNIDEYLEAARVQR
jgi:proteasome accessory factor C